MSNWYVVGLRKDTPAEIVEKLNREINAALTDAKMTVRLADLGNTAIPESSANLGSFVAQETEKLAKVVRTANLKPE
jgi:tripartite-type tricarboxylate transporter receptor subunit TctC